MLCSRIPDEEDDLEGIIIRYKKKKKKKKKREKREDDDVEQLRRIMCVPCDDVVEQNQIRKRTAITKGVKRKRGHECDVCEKVFRIQSIWPDTCVRTRKRNRTNAMCARSVLVNLVI